jgi:glutamyl/glutaminyl-tRNA synthetase
MPISMNHSPYRGRIAPSPTGYLHLGHASTFKIAHNRARENNGILILRNEDLDLSRCKKEYTQAIIEDLKWMGISWDEGPINQTDRIHLYLEAWFILKSKQTIYPCQYSRKEIQTHSTIDFVEEEPIFPKKLRPKELNLNQCSKPEDANWRFKVPDGKKIHFIDENYGPQEFETDKDFGDFLVWRRDGIPSYELAVVVDDHLMGITEVVRGADLLKSTARQLLLYQAFGWSSPRFYHCDLVCDEFGKRLSKHNGAKRLREFSIK